MRNKIALFYYVLDVEKIGVRWHKTTSQIDKAAKNEDANSFVHVHTKRSLVAEHFAL
jgi:hypothetical protein